MDWANQLYPQIIKKEAALSGEGGRVIPDIVKKKVGQERVDMGEKVKESLFEKFDEAIADLESRDDGSLMYIIMNLKDVRQIFEDML